MSGHLARAMLAPLLEAAERGLVSEDETDIEFAAYVLQGIARRRSRVSKEVPDVANEVIDAILELNAQAQTGVPVPPLKVT